MNILRKLLKSSCFCYKTQRNSACAVFRLVSEGAWCPTQRYGGFKVGNRLLSGDWSVGLPPKNKNILNLLFLIADKFIAMYRINPILFISKHFRI